MRRSRRSRCACCDVWGIESDSRRCLAALCRESVRIFQHDDDPGRNAGALWAAQLIAAGVEVDGYSFAGLSRVDGGAVKDLNDFAHVHPDQWEEQRNIIEEAFSFALEGPLRGSGGIADREYTGRANGVAGLWQGLSDISRSKVSIQSGPTQCRAMERDEIGQVTVSRFGLSLRRLSSRAFCHATSYQSLESRHGRSCLAIGSSKATWALYSLHEVWEKRGLP